MPLYIIVLLVILFAFFVYFNYRKMKNMPLPEDNENILSLNSNNFESKIKQGLVMVDFWAPWCGPCRMLAPTINSIAETESGKVIVGKVNIDENKQLASQFGIRSIPTLVFFKDGKELKRISGIKSKKQLVDEIHKLQ